jgi:ADP-ribose pyrophosphatase
MADDVDVTDRQVAFKGYFRVDRYRLRHRLHDGGRSPELVREVFERGHIAAVLPFDPVRDAVVLIEQFRPGAYAAGWQPWLLECVAGIIEQDEMPEDVVRREALEEAGCTLMELIPVARFLSSPGASSETVELYCGRCDSEGISGVHGLQEEGEDILVSVVPVSAAFQMVEEARIVNAKTLVALQWLELHHSEVRQRWLSSDP